MLALTVCRSCGARVFWVMSEKRKPFLLDAEPCEHGLWQVVGGVAVPVQSLFPRPGPRYNSHFATCPHADKWRKTK